MTDRRPRDSEIINRGVELLEAGVLASGIPNRLMDEYSLTPEKARELAGKAIERHKRGKDTKPLDQEPGE